MECLFKALICGNSDVCSISDQLKHHILWIPKCVSKAIRVTSKTVYYHIKSPQMVGYVCGRHVESCCVSFRTAPSPFTPSPTHTQVLSIKLTDRIGVSVHPVQSHASLCHCLLHVHTKTVDELICVRVLASLFYLV